jgi:hypothetical protein
MVVVIVVIAVALALIFLYIVVANIVNGGHKLFKRSYPARFGGGVWFRRSRLVVNDWTNSSIGPTLGMVARGTILFLGPLVFLVRTVRGWTAWKERRTKKVGDLPLSGSRPFRAVIRAVIDIANDGGYLRDGYAQSTTKYDDWLKDSFPEIAHFLSWWPDVKVLPEDYGYPAGVSALRGGTGSTRRGFGAHLQSQPAPDPRGFPGLASAVIRRTKVQGLRDLFLSAREIDDMCDPNLDDHPEAGVIRVVRTESSGCERWIVQIASTQSWHPRAGTAPNDLTADLMAVSGRETALLRGALQAIRLAKVPQKTPVLLTGFSLGGLIAAQLATGRYTVPGRKDPLQVTHLVTAGSPIARFPIAPGVKVLSLEHKLDPVHRLDGRPRFTEDVGAATWITAAAGPPLPLDYKIGNTHHAPSYAETGESLGFLPLEVVADFMYGDLDAQNGLWDFFAGTQTVSDFAVMRKVKGLVAQPSVPVYVQLGSAGQTRGRMRTFLRQLEGVIAADVYVSRSGFPTSKSWSADVLVSSLGEWATPDRRLVAYEGLLDVSGEHDTAGVNMRVMGRSQPEGYISTSLRRTGKNTWIEELDVAGPLDGLDFEPLPFGELVVAAILDPRRKTFVYSQSPFTPSRVTGSRTQRE